MKSIALLLAAATAGTLAVAAVPTAAVAAAPAADISGTWTTSFDSQVGQQTYTYTFKVDGGKLTGLAGFRQLYDPVRAAFSDINFVVQEVVESGDAAAVRWTCTGRHTGDQMGIAASGKPVAFGGMAIVHFRDGKITESFDQWDRLGFLTQIGALPTKA